MFHKLTSALPIILILWTQPVTSTFDLNLGELQMVADHLTSDECRRLSEALHMTHFFLDHHVSGSSEPNLPCIELLLHWDSHEGKGKTFHDLALRLREIERPDVAAILSRAVYHEKADAVRDAFLRDPFLEEIDLGSNILDEAPKRKPRESA